MPKQQPQAEAGNSKISNNLCETHFPEVILYHFDKPVCRKCLPELLQQKGKGFNEGQLKDIFSMLGMNEAVLNTYSTEKNLISRTLQKVDDIKRGVKYQKLELEERKNESDKYLKELPKQMDAMFKHLNGLVAA